MAAPPACTIAEAHARLTAPGARYEMEQVLIDGRVLRSFKSLHPSLRAFWLASVKAYRDKPYVVYESQRLTYHQVHERASRLASAFRTDYHIRKGDRVAIAMRNCGEWIIAFWACHLLGAVSVLVNAWLPVKPFMHCLTHTGAKLVIVDPERAALLAPHTSSLRSGARVLLASATGGTPSPHLRRFSGMDAFDAVIDSYAGPAEAWRREAECALDDNATIFFTSGTTGLPKGVLSTHRSFMHGYIINAFARDRMFLRRGLPPLPDTDPTWEKTSMLGVPLFHVTGTTSALMSVTVMGFKLVLLRKWDKEKAAELVRTERVNHFIGVPSMAFDLFETDLKGYEALETIGYGGAPAAATIPGTSQKVFPNAVPGQGYGLTETNAPVAGHQGPDYLARPTSTGPATPINDLVIMDTNTGKALPPGQIGELWIRGANIMREYWGNKEETAKAITLDGFFKSGDLAYLDEEGFVYICDRKKDMIIRGGENIHSVNVENAIYADQRIHDVAVVGIPDRRLGELVGALVVPTTEYFGQVTEDEIIERCKESLPHFAIPSLVLIQKDPIGRNATGKIVKVDVRKTLAEEWRRRHKAQTKEAGKKGRVKAKL